MDQNGPLQILQSALLVGWKKIMYGFLDKIMVVLGGVILTGSWIPQIIKVLRTRSSRDLSIPFLIAASSGTLLLVPYSILINDTFFILVNLFAGLFAAATLIAALFFRKR